MTLIDLSHVVEHQMATYPGLPGPRIGSHLSFEDSIGRYAEGTQFQIGRIEMVANTGTYLDTPAHRYPDGHDLSGLALERCADLPVSVCRRAGAIDAASLADLDIAGRAVLLHTGWDEHWRTDRYGQSGHPYLTEDGAEFLVAAGAALVGIDSVNIDDTTGDARPAHTILLAAGIPVVEHLTALADVRDGDRFFAVPVAIKGLATFPVRAFVIRDAPVGGGAGA